MRVPPHPVGNDVEAQIVARAVAVLVMWSLASDIADRTRFEFHRQVAALLPLAGLSHRRRYFGEASFQLWMMRPFRERCLVDAFGTREHARFRVNGPELDMRLG